jgi:hypothetical protein
MKAAQSGEDAMRSLLFGSIIIVLTLADLTPAAARKARHYSGTQPSYSACVCVIGGTPPITAETLARSRSHATVRVVSA